MTPENPLRAWILRQFARLAAFWRQTFRTKYGPYGNTITRFGRQSYIQRSSHGAICDVRLGPLVIWADPRTGKPFYTAIH